MHDRIPLPTTLRGASFTVKAGLENGASIGRLRRADLEKPFWGVRTPVGGSATLGGLAEALLSRRSDAVLSFTSAAQLWDLPLPRRFSSMRPVHIAVTPPTRAPAGADVAGHQTVMTEADVTVHRGIPVTTLERTWCDLAIALSDEDLVAVGDNILSFERDEPANRDSLAAAIDRYPTVRRQARLKRIAGFLADRAESDPESRFRWRFARAGLPPAEANLEIFDASGTLVARCDIAFEQYRVAFDYEGDHHRIDQRQWRKDLRRVPRLQDLGWHHIRGSALDLGDSRDMIARLRRVLRERGWRG